MTLINNLIRQAKSDPRPAELVIPAHRVRQVAEHARLMRHDYDKLTCTQLAEMIERGETQILGIPVRVSGHAAR